MANRRPHREGTISKRADGRWEAKLRDGPRRISLYGRTQREVLDKLSDAKQRIRQGLDPKPQHQTVGQFLDIWLEEIVKPARRPKTITCYCQIVDIHIRPAIGHLPLQLLLPQHVQALLNSKLRSGLSRRTVQAIREVLRNALNNAIKWDLVTRNAAALAQAPQAERRKAVVLDPAQAQAFLEAAKAHRLGSLFSVILALGLRIGEALGLTWDVIDFDGGSVTVLRQIQRISGKLELVDLKTEKSRRTIALPSFAVTALQERRIAQLEDRLIAADRWQDTGFVFTSTIGTPLDDSAARRAFKTILSNAHLPVMRVHDLRHTCASLLIAQGVHPRTIMEILGHSQISLTMNTYSHVIQSLQTEAAEKLDGIIGN